MDVVTSVVVRLQTRQTRLFGEGEYTYAKLKLFGGFGFYLLQPRYTGWHFLHDAELC